MKSQANFLKANVLALTVALTGLFATVSGQTAVSVSDNKPTLSVNYLGGVGDKLYFEVTMQQPEDTKSFLKIKDEDGVQLYSELVTRKSLTKRIQIPKSELTQVDFVFSTGKEEIKKSYEIKLEYREVLEIKDVTTL